MMIHSHSLVRVCMSSVCFLMVSMGLMQKVFKLVCNCENGELDFWMHVSYLAFQKP